MHQENEHLFIEKHKDTNIEPGKDDESDGNEEVPNKLIKTKAVLYSVGRMTMSGSVAVWQSKSLITHNFSDGEHG